MTLDELRAELDRGRIFECSLRDRRFVIDGLQDGENIYIDPRPAILETLIHELLHRRYPRLGERRVLAESRRLLLRMTEQQKAQWWRAYLRVRKKGRPVELAD